MKSQAFVNLYEDISADVIGSDGVKTPIRSAHPLASRDRQADVPDDDDVPAVSSSNSSSSSSSSKSKGSNRVSVVTLPKHVSFQSLVQGNFHVQNLFNY